MVRVKKREEPTSLDEIDVMAAQYIHLKSEIKERTAEADKLKSKIMTFLDQNGEEDDQGSLWYHLPDEIEGIKAVKRERRSTPGVDEDEAFRILQEKGLYKKCYRLEPVLDQQAVMAAVTEGLITDAELEQMFPNKLSWALVTSKS